MGFEVGERVTGGKMDFWTFLAKLVSGRVQRSGLVELAGCGPREIRTRDVFLGHLVPVTRQLDFLLGYSDCRGVLGGSFIGFEIGCLKTFCCV